MGGHAFSLCNPPLATPRLPPDLYHSLCASYTAALRTLYGRVAIPTPAPGKTSHGDVDILLSSAKVSSLSAATTVQEQQDDQNPVSSLHYSLSASLPTILKTLRPTPHAHLPCPASSNTTSLAVPHPTVPDAYVQVDLTYIPDESFFAWAVFQNSHGDLVNMLAPALRTAGLVMAGGAGLCVVSEEIGEVERKRARCVLSVEPGQVVEWLWGEQGGYGVWEVGDGEEARAFESEEELFKTIARMRFFEPAAYERHDLKSNDRRRMEKRDQYRRFCDKWVPALKAEEEGDAGEKTWERAGREAKRLRKERVLQEALETFGKKEVWEDMHRSWREEREQLANRKEARERRKLEAVEGGVYADAWVEVLNREKEVGAG